MKIKNILLAAVIVFLITSCGDKKEEKKVVSEPIKEEVVKVEPVVEQPVEVVVEEVIEEPQIRTVIVKEGEWLYDIAREEYGNMSGWQKIYDANKDKIDNPDMIFPNQELIIPE